MEQIKKNFSFGCMRLPMNGENIRPFFESQLAACGVEYFDFYLMHAQGAGNYPHFKACHAYETAFAPGRRASDCVKRGRCEKVCPQHLPIRRLLEDVAKEFEKEAN